MQKITTYLSIIATFTFIMLPLPAEALVQVDGYYRDDGTYVEPHYRSEPDGLEYNNLGSDGIDVDGDGYGAGRVNDMYTNDIDASDLYESYEETYRGDTGGTINNTYDTSDRYNTGYNSSYGNTGEPEDTTADVPNNATANSYGGWSCDDGYKKNYTTNTCEKVHVPANASLNYSEDDWICNDGYEEVGNRCERIDVPANAHLSSFGDDWYCDDGYKQVGERCERIDIPANAHLSSFGDDWYCDDGYEKVGDSCREINVPANAYMSIWGDNWYCEEGYEKVGNRCEEEEKDITQTSRFSEGSTINIKQNVVSAITLNPNRECDDLAILPYKEDKCHLYKNHKDDYSWNVIE